MSCCRRGCDQRAAVLVSGAATVVGEPGGVVLLPMCPGCSDAATLARPDLVDVRRLPQRRRTARSA